MNDSTLKQPHNTTFKTLWLATGFFLMALIAYGSLAPSVDTGQWFQYQDKVIHACAYCVMCWWFLQACRSTAQCRLIMVVAFLFGLSIEIAQSYTANRFAEFFDLLANTLGIFLAAAIRYWQPFTCLDFISNHKKSG